MPATLPIPLDANRARVGLETWNDAAGKLGDRELAAWARALAADPDGRRLIGGIAANSPFLATLLPREISTVRDAMVAGFDTAFAALIAQLDATLADERDTERLMSTLRLAKRKVAVLVALADLIGAWPLEAVTGALSQFAETALGLATTHLLRRAGDQGRLTLPDPTHPCVGSGFFVLAMGKLGAKELNYSSDIDLIVFYDDEVAQTAQPDTLSRTFIRIARDLVRIMEERTKDGYVFRTDLRLRPDPGATPLAVSVTAADIYYGSVGQNWERAAMIKARAVAGDLAAAGEFLRALEPFVWRRNLDFAAIQDIHSIKRQINAHKGHRVVTVNGHDLKVGRGGIREIEFFAQTQQLIFGGRDPSLRTAGTVASLYALANAGRIPFAAAAELESAYRFLRTVEHRVQMVDDQQTHRLPESDGGVGEIAGFLGYADAGAFRQVLLKHMGAVEDHYAKLFEAAPPLAPGGNLVFTGTDDDPATLDTLKTMGFAEPARVIAIVSAWHRGRIRATRSARARELLTELAPTLLRELARTPQPDTALLHLDQVLTRLPAGIDVFSLLHANPKLLELIADIMGSAPRLAETLARNPKLLDAVLSSSFFAPLPDREDIEREYAAFIARARDFEDRLGLARAWTNDQRFRAGVHLLRGLADGWSCAPFLAALADVVVSDLARAVEEDFAKRHGRIAGARWGILAMGKLGSRQLTIASDIDLIVIYDAPQLDGVSDGPRPLSIAEYFIKLTQRLIGAITAPMPDGRLYEVDMRLRPSGNAGPLAVSLKGFLRYQTAEAWTWEHMALTRGRAIHGEPALRSAIEAAITTVLTGRRDSETLLRDVADMRQRIEKEYGTTNPWDVKYARGGMIDLDFIAQYLQLRHAATHGEVLSVDTVDVFRRCAAAGLLDPATATVLAESERCWLRIQGYLRLTTITAPTPDTMTPALLAGIARAVVVADTARDPGQAVDFDQLDTILREREATAYGHWAALIDNPAQKLPPRADGEGPRPALSQAHEPMRQP